MSNKGSRLPKARKPPKTVEKKKSRISVAVTVVLSIATLLGGVAAAVAFLPRVTLTVSAPVDLKNPFSSSVTITNTGYIPLKSVAVWIGIGVLCSTPCSAPDFPDSLRDYQSRIHRMQWGAHDMEIDDKFTISLDDVFRFSEPGGLQYADIAVIVEYKIPIIHLKREKTFPLYTRKATNGRLYWFWK